MNRLSSINKAIALSTTLALSIVSVPALAWVIVPGSEPEPQPSEIWDPRTGEMRHTLVLYQRVSERVLNTEEGEVIIPPTAEIRDTRRVDDWYLQKNAKVTLVGINGRIVRVEIKN